MRSPGKRLAASEIRRQLPGLKPTGDGVILIDAVDPERKFRANRLPDEVHLQLRQGTSESSRPEMVKERAQRRLAAILAADVAGYSRLMGVDEEGTLARLKALRRDLLDPKIDQHRGRIVKTTGDGLLTEFASVIDAVRCAVEIQCSLAEYNGDVEPERRIAFRIGINVGDIIVEGDDIYGDGVNVAARLEGIAAPAGICIAASVYEHVKGKLALSYEDAGFQAVKNIADPVHVYRVRVNDPKPINVERPLSESVLPLPAKPSIAVLPFDNMSGDPGQTYFCDGITEDIITELARYRSLFIIARHSSFVFRDQPVTMAEIGQKLGVQYVVEGSVRKAGNQVRITAQLVDAVTGSHLWAERYDRRLEDLFAMQDELTHAIVSTVAGQLEAAQIEQAKRKRTDNMAAYDHFLRGTEHHQRFTKEDHRQAREHFQRAIQLDPGFGLAHACLALICIGAWGETASAELLDEAFRLASRGVRLDTNESRCHVVLGFSYLMRRQFDRALAHTEKALTLNPNDGHGMAHLCLIYSYLGQPEKGLPWARSATRLNPYHPDWYSIYNAHALYGMRQYSEATTLLERVTAGSLWHHAVLAACYGQAGYIEEAQKITAQLLDMRPEFRARNFVSNEPYKSATDAEHFLEGLQKAGLP